MSKVVLQKNMQEGKLTFRYPQLSDAQAMLDYINTLSREKTFISFQGEQMTLDWERKFLKEQLKKFKEKKALQLLAFIGDKLVGIADITLKGRVEKHIGVFGISMAKDYRRKGIGKLLTKEVLKESKKLPDLKVIILEVFANNPLALSMYEKLGFTKYGILPGGIFYKNNYIDSVQMYKVV